ncbi:ferredoxin [Nocardia sp. NPDC127526]|uniref:ferredoxin n=1 Tax=Nocardia sp. NPDC127526 TaxID=3345393 RepID=UPI00364141C8
MRITADRDRCCGSGMCALTAPEIFDQSPDDGLVVLVDPAPAADRHAVVHEAIRNCPVGALSATDPTTPRTGGS